MRLCTSLTFKSSFMAATKSAGFPVALALIILLFTGCGSLGVLVDGSGGSPSPAPRPAPAPQSYPSYRTLKIPPGHLPPPGQCRIWYPGKPPGHQPPPTSCESAMASAKGNGWVISRAAGNKKILEVKERKSTGPKVEIVIRHYMID